MWDLAGGPGSAVAKVLRAGDDGARTESVLPVEALAVGHERIARDVDLQAA